MKGKKITCWDDCSVNEFIQIAQILEIKDSVTEIEKESELLSIINKMDVSKLTVSEYSKLRGSLSFLQDEISKDKRIPKKISLGGHEYDVSRDITKINAAQFIDYQTFVKKGIYHIGEILAIFIIPKGHEYNDGYDLEKVIQDIEEEMSIPFANSFAFFLVRQYMEFILLLGDYSIKKMKKVKVEKKIINQTRIHYLNMVSSIMSSLS